MTVSFSSHLSPERNHSHAQPRSASELGETSSLPHLHHAHGWAKDTVLQPLAGDHHPSCHCLLLTLVFARIPTNSQNRGFSWGLVEADTSQKTPFYSSLTSWGEGGHLH